MVKNIHSNSWYTNPLRHRFGASAYSLANITLLIGTLSYIGMNSVNPLMGACFMGAFLHAALNMAIVKSSMLQRTISERFSSPPSDDLQERIDGILERAGVDHKIIIRVADINSTNDPNAGLFFRMVDKWCNGLSWRTQVNYGVHYAYRAHGDDGEDVIIIGQKCLEMLNDEELEAVICHEVGHIKNPNSLPIHSQLDIAINTHLLFAITGAFFDPLMALLSAGSFFTSKLLKREAGRHDEFRADFNSILHYPHETALKSALEKVKTKRHDILHAETWSYTSLMTYASDLFNEHPPLSQRARAIDKWLPYVKDVYRREGIALPTPS